MRAKRQIGHLQGVKVGVLGVGNLGLAAKADALHGDAVRRVDMGADHKCAVIGENLIGAENIGRGANLAAAELLLRHTKGQEQVFHHANAGPLRKDGQDMKAEGGSEFEARQDQNLAQQAAVLGKAFGLGRLKPVQVFQQFKVFDFAPEFSVAADRVVIGEGDNVQFLLFRTFQNVEGGNVGLLVVAGRGSVNVKVDPEPGALGLVLWRR